MILEDASFACQVWHFGRDPWRVTGFGHKFDSAEAACSFLQEQCGPLAFKEEDQLIDTFAGRSVEEKLNLAVVYRCETTTVVASASLADGQGLDIGWTG